MSRRWWAPEVVQTSDMDCGPAALACLLQGYGLPAHYGRLREACQTDVDGTSIDTLQDVADRIGMDVDQVVIPPDHVFLDGAGALPGLVVIVLPNQSTHFVVMWRVVGPYVMVMDPGRGRLWRRVEEATAELYRYTMEIQGADWLDWARTDEFTRCLRARMGRLGLDAAAQTARIEAALAPGDWFSLAALDAAVRLVTALQRAGGLPRGEAGALIDACAAAAIAEGPGVYDTISPLYWTVRPGEAPGGVRVTGAVVLRVRGPKDPTQGLDLREASEDLRRALTTEAERPLRDLYQMATAGGALHPGWLVAAAGLGAGGLLVEAVLLRGLIEAGRLLVPLEQRMGALLALGLFGLALLAVDLGLSLALAAAGRHLELRYRAAFLRKLPRLPDRYFQSRLISDKAERGHALTLIRQVGPLLGAAARSAFLLLFTLAGVIALHPAVAPWALLTALLSVGLPLAAQPLLAGQDLRWRQHSGALFRLYLDALRGLVAIRTHGAARNLLREHEGLLQEWSAAGLGLLRTAALAEAAQAALGIAGCGALLAAAVGGSAAEAPLSLLLAWWALQLPAHGASLAAAIRRYPSVRSVVLRLMEPLSSPELEEPAADAAPLDGPVSIELVDLSVVAGGHTILDGVNLHIAAGEHLAVVGPSGAGKSSLVGLLLGWHAVAAGALRVNGAPLDAAALGRLRRHTAWVDPDVALWNEGLTENLTYGGGALGRLGAVLDEAALRSLQEELPAGLATPLGEGGGLVSGGQGQRVRFGRALLRDDVRLVILDEPFRGLDRDQRRALLQRARARWSGATLLCVTHDIADTALFSRVLVVEDKRIVEDGDPATLGADPDSRYARLQAAETRLRTGLWGGPGWRRWRLQGGQVAEGPR